MPALLWQLHTDRCTILGNKIASGPPNRSNRVPNLLGINSIDFNRKSIDFNRKSILFQSRPLLAARSRTPRLSKPLIFLMILIRNRYLFSPGRPGAQNRCFIQSFMHSFNHFLTMKINCPALLARTFCTLGDGNSLY